ncbi:MAG: N-acetyl-gamma-glutamyl-phosphate reductase, partial [Rhodospirillaceae bacterium]|nr:N-acetyl-gamma-glutamyl-phosphate reductase [Rhodospirillaceae bacterium]
ADRVTNPGCYAITSVAILHPLVKSGVLHGSAAVTINAISGYSGGGRKMIEAYEDKTASPPFSVYGLGLNHKHVPEIKAWSGLDRVPLFMPSVGNFRQGMLVQVPLQLSALPGAPSPTDIHATLSNHYQGQKFVQVASLEESSTMTGLEPGTLNGSNNLCLHVFGNEENGQAVVVGMLDNLGKGASGQAVQNLNLMLGVAEDTGLV